MKLTLLLYNKGYKIFDNPLYMFYKLLEDLIAL